MTPILFRCPVMGLNVQGLVDDDEIDSDSESDFVGIKCLACNRMHYVNPATGRVLGGGED